VKWYLTSLGRAENGRWARKNFHLSFKGLNAISGVSSIEGFTASIFYTHCLPAMKNGCLYRCSGANRFEHSKRFGGQDDDDSR
jgi:hypothetical protein